METPAQLLPAVAALARRAGDAILQVYRQDFAVDHKGDDSPLTAADLASHRCIMDGLAGLTPELPRLSEEGADIPFAERSRWRRYWLIDPLDGTREFVKRNGEFTVNIALVEDGRPVLGVVHAPVLGTTYLAADGAGAFKQDGDAPAAPIRCSRTASPARIVASRSHVTPELEALLKRLPPHEALNIGSSLKLCLVAEGKADFYPRLGLTSEWDTAAGQAVVEQAGGRVCTTDGAPLRYNQKDSLLNPDFLVIGEPDYPWLTLFVK
ncbi:MAG TPA: 3'(2'),5'-bisphosphate nucleotidase CysQ [Nevskiales bacterium]|nr:3'(2'),5'-bisphosphate nucleotidase CysQ [Nevskiales bacterium]